MLHERGEEVFARDPELLAAHRERQETLRHRQEFYRIRLEHELDAQHVIRQMSAPDAILADEAERVDRRHPRARQLAPRQVRGGAFGLRGGDGPPRRAPRCPITSSSCAGSSSECDAIAIGGGHVATLLNRLVLFHIADLVETRPVFAWCAGAMALSDRVVLFHDSPPQGPGVAEVLDAGLGLVPGTVVLPQPEDRLRLDDTERVQVMARRFAPAVCLAMPARSRITWTRGRFTAAHDVTGLMPDGKCVPLETPARGVQ